MSNSIVQFLEGVGTDSRGRHIDEIFRQDNFFWERTHDFIQWLFPLTVESQNVSGSPVLDDEDIKLILRSKPAQEAMQHAVERFKQFLIETEAWKRENDHNHLRISRVIKSLRLLVNDEEANAFKYWIAGQLGDRIDSINADSKRHWRLS